MARERMLHRRDVDHFAGCLLGGAVGDALGAPVEFMDLQDIRERFGPKGIRSFAPCYGRVGAITDDTQMTLFTAEGLLRANTRGQERGIVDIPSLVHQSYLRWLHTQGESSRFPLFEKTVAQEGNGWLIRIKALYSPRGPGITCLSALCSGKMGALDDLPNDSKGCGAVMRAAPVGLLFDDPAMAFDIGCETGVITHGHPSGYLSAGALAAIISAICNGKALREAIATALALLQRQRDHEECTVAIEKAVATAAQGPASAEMLASVGEGWVGEEALAIALYCALSEERNFRRAVELAVNHSGDSDSTGAITGNILGALHGRGAIPAEWLDALELRHEIEQIAEDLLVGHRDDPAWAERYPGF